MMKAHTLVMMVAVAAMAAGLALCAPVIRGTALCKQPLPGEKEAYTRLANLALVTVPDGKPVRLFPKTPARVPPTRGFFDAWLLDAGRLVLVHAHYKSDTRDGYLLLINPATGKLSIIADAIARDSVMISPDRKTVLYKGRSGNGVSVWHTDGRRMCVRPPEGWNGGACEWTARMPHPRMTFVRTRSGTEGKFWLDESGGTLKPIAGGDPWAKALDVCSGKYVYADKNWDLWLVSPGRKKAKLARLEVYDEPPEDIWCMFSPDGRYVAYSFGRSIGEPRINYAAETHCFDLRGAKPVRLTRPEDSDEVYVPTIVGWYSAESGILHTSVWDLMWTAVPSLKTVKVATLPDECEFVDFVRKR